MQLSFRRPPLHELDLARSVPAPRPASPLAHLGLDASSPHLRKLNARIDVHARRRARNILNARIKNLPCHLQDLVTQRALRMPYERARANPATFFADPQRATALIDALSTPAERNAAYLDALQVAIDHVDPLPRVDVLMHLRAKAPILAQPVEEAIRSIACDFNFSFEDGRGAISATRALIELLSDLPLTHERTEAYRELHALAHQRINNDYCDESDVTGIYDALCKTRLPDLSQAQKHSQLLAAVLTIEDYSYRPPAIAALAANLPQGNALEAFTTLFQFADDADSGIGFDESLVFLSMHIPKEAYADGHALLRNSLHLLDDNAYFCTALRALLYSLPPGEQACVAHEHLATIVSNRTFTGDVPQAVADKAQAYAVKLLLAHLPESAAPQLTLVTQLLLQTPSRIASSAATFRTAAFALPPHASARHAAEVVRQIAARNGDHELMALTALSLPAELSRPTLLNDCAQFIQRSNAAPERVAESLTRMHDEGLAYLTSPHEHAEHYFSLRRFQQHLLQYIVPQLTNAAARQETIKFLLFRPQATALERSRVHEYVRNYARSLQAPDRFAVVQELIKQLPHIRSVELQDACTESLALTETLPSASHRLIAYSIFVAATSSRRSTELQAMRPAVLASAIRDPHPKITGLVEACAIVHAPADRRTIAEQSELRRLVRQCASSSPASLTGLTRMLTAYLPRNADGSAATAEFADAMAVAQAGMSPVA